MFTLMFATVLAGQGAPLNEAESKLSAALRGLLVAHLPDPLYQKSQNWGHTKMGFSRLRWRGQGLEVHPEVVRSEKEDGEWKKLQVFAVNPSESLQLSVSNVAHPEDGVTRFDLTMTLPVRLLFERQIWRAGIKLYSGSIKARTRIHLLLACEMTSKLEPAKLLPELILRVRVVTAKVAYDNFVMEHVAGVGGEAAELIGDVARQAIHQWKPSIERDLLAKANNAVVKAADSREIRIGLEGIKRKKK